ncbi:monosaccharide ABC transporter membrane protein, CUT2 family (TC 3.A.1.2.-) [Pseudoxanthobacter soli DSM 19599]|uniref:Monosaccharide ABC transporter membrane protein, CUT2 family (TC 3.A.1.2.-) n=1 Tax=Pseudoxanthobacter soli DSM 19599 TaxID=1123029 RepID=A0A1M7ZF81_9HYPH|nr:ABC transporter permease [Pseudoxanthobacter soli]SHO63533.1 monosaccharide ABC transporter membrane protein, CUT2 family (TC 3.A.1.2.-) [Pseudoxanthobacter soli DSM 19599]
MTDLANQPSLPVTVGRRSDHALSWRQLTIKSGIFVLLAVMIVAFQTQEPAFLRIANIFSILQAVAIVALLGIGVTVSSAVGGFDLSVGALAALSQMAAAYVLIVLNGSGLEAVAVTLAIGALVGLINAFLIVRLRVPDLLATLGMLFLLAGLQLIPTGGRSIAPGMALLDGSSATGVFPAEFLALGRARLWGVVPVPVVVLAVVAVAFWFLMERTRWGRVFYAVGGSELAAHLAGAPTRLYRTSAYVLSSLIASLGGILLAARLGRGDVSAGNSLMLDAVAASLIGYAVLGASRPNVFGTVVGAVFVGVLLNGLTMLNAPYYLQDFVKGAVLIGALALTFGLARRTA